MLHAWELPGDYRIPSAALLFLVGPGGGGGICEPGFVAGIADTEPLHFAKYYSDPLPQIENEEEVPPNTFKKAKKPECAQWRTGVHWSQKKAELQEDQMD